MSAFDRIVDSVQGNKEKEQSGNGRWIGALVAGMLVMIIAAVFGFIAWKRGKEMAKLLHEKAVREEEEHQAKVDAQLASSEEERQMALAAATEALAAQEELERERQRIEEEHHEIRKRLDAITSWDDVDSFLGGGS